MGWLYKTLLGPFFDIFLHTGETLLTHVHIPTWKKGWKGRVCSFTCSHAVKVRGVSIYASGGYLGKALEGDVPFWFKFVTYNSDHI